LRLLAIMKRFRIQITLSILTLAIGVFFVWLAKYDSNIYPVEFSELLRESKNYDGKIVEIKASFVQGYEAMFLTGKDHKEAETGLDIKEVISAKCLLAEEPYRKVIDSLHESQERQEKIIVIGRYRDSEYQEYDGYVHKIEILEVKPVNTLQTIK
jgi:hypothetical protein